VLTKTVYEMLPYAGIVYTMSFENKYWYNMLIIIIVS
jgi:hypothetical protein